MTKKSKIFKTKLWNSRIKNSSKNREILSEKFNELKCIFFLQANRSKSITRRKNRCAITGRPRGYMRDFNMSRNCVREFAALGWLSGVKKV